MSPLFKNMVRRKFGRLVVLKRAPNDKHHNAQWLCRCQCGTKKVIRAGQLRSGMTRSCGCLAREWSAEINKNGKARFKHGATALQKRKLPAAYRSWMSMNQRCYDTNCDNYLRYGGRGIRVCARWRGKNGFANFLKDMGSRPKGKTLDRKNNNRNYTPGNCRWATPKQQANNRGALRKMGLSS